MGFISTILGIFGFGIGISVGLVVGYFLFIYWQSTDVKDPIIRPVGELDSKSLQSLMSEIPLWVKHPDYDRVDWINKFISDLWPYLDKAICKTIRETTKPMIEEYRTKFKIDSVNFECLSLGTLPPTLQGIKAHDTEEKEMIIEPALKWAGNPNVFVVVKAFGMRATVQLVDLQVFAIARISLKPLVPVFPCFSKITVSLMEKPHVDFGLKLLGGDLMAIPGLYGMVQDIIKDQVANMYLWPKTLEVPVLDESSIAMASKKPVGMLQVVVVCAKGLRKADLLGKSDPYVKLSLSDSGRHAMKKTQVKPGTLNPVWNESFTLVVQDPESQVLEMNIFDWEKVSSHDKLGMVVIPLHDLTPNETKEITENVLKNMDPNDPANQKARGQITVQLTYKPFKEENGTIPEDDAEGSLETPMQGDVPEGGGLLIVHLHEAEDLEGKHRVNPYAKLLYQGEVRKTKSLKNNNDPRWDEEFQFILPEPPVDHKIRVEVKSVRTGMGLHTREHLGHVEINLSDVVSNKRINERYSLVGSKNGKIQVELLWRA